MPTMATFMQLLPKDFETAPCRTTDAAVFAVVEGAGRSEIDGQLFDWGPRDNFIAPSWKQIRQFADEEAVIFSFSGQAAQQKLGFWREERQKN